MTRVYSHKLGDFFPVLKKMANSNVQVTVRTFAGTLRKETES